MGIYIFLELIPAAIILIMFFWLRKEKEQILSQDSTPFYIDDDYYWRKGWYNNPNDKRYFVQDRVNSMNYSLNYGHPSAKYITGGMLVGTGLLLLWMCILCIRIDFTPIRLTENAAQYSITSGYKTATFALADVESVTLLDNLPDENSTGLMAPKITANFSVISVAAKPDIARCISGLNILRFFR